MNKQEQFQADYADYLANSDRLAEPDFRNYGISFDEAYALVPELARERAIDYLSGSEDDLIESFIPVE